MNKTNVSDGAKLADVKPATAFEQSGAPIQSADIDTQHPAVDADLRAGTTVDQNRIDFNDPTLDGPDAVAQALGYKKEG